MPRRRQPPSFVAIALRLPHLEPDTLDIKLVNLGLVREATITLRDLNVIMGSNNSGKSTAATALYAAAKAASEIRGLTDTPQPRIFSSFAARQSRSLYGNAEVQTISERLQKAGDEQDLTAAITEISPIIGRALLRDFGRRFVRELEKSLGIPITELATRTTQGRRLPLRVQFVSDTWLVDIRLRKDQVNVTADVRELITPDASGLTSQFFGGHYVYDDSDIDLFLSLSTQDLAHRVFSDFPRRAHYLPAARAGLLQSHRLVAAALVQRSPQVGIGEVSMPALSGVVADFISEILLSDQDSRRRKALQSTARQIQQAVMKGEVRQVSTPGGYPDIDFKDDSGDYPIHRTSSMVSELAPIVLLLSRTVERGDLLIIEEPESHLHPKAQVDLSRILFSAASKVSLLLTTHSDYIVAEINNQLRRQALSPSKAVTIDAGAYFMDRRTDVGSDLRPLKVTAVDGIPEDSFADVSAALYDEQVTQQERLIGAEN